LLSYGDLMVCQNGGICLGFLKAGLLTVATVQMVNMRDCRKFRDDESNRCRDLRFFNFFKMVVVHHLGFVMCMFEV